MIVITKKENCCGCGSCAQICPKTCITMQEDEEGFLYPHTDRNACTDCHLCESVCPMQTGERSDYSPLKCVATVNVDDDIRRNSSSGGLFYSLATSTIKKGGVVFAVVSDDRGEATHTKADSIDGIRPMMESKYMQSRVDYTFRDVKDALREGKHVLFVGTPCQVEGLNHFLLGKTPENLMTVNVACYGAPSPGVWRQYLNETLGESENKTIVHFRDKSSGWRSYSIFLQRGDMKMKMKPSRNPFMACFFGGMIMRPSCYNCHFKSGGGHSDITVGDFWGVNKSSRHELDDDKGIGIALINTPKGMAAMSECDGIRSEEVAYAEAVACNGGFQGSVKPHPKRDAFFEMLRNGCSVKQASDKLLMKPLHVRALRFAKHLISQFIRRIK